jgi:hypothetical protein
MSQYGKRNGGNVKDMIHPLQIGVEAAKPLKRKINQGAIITSALSALCLLAAFFAFYSLSQA